MRFEFDWVDAFTDQVFNGNGCAVVHGGAVLPDAVCTAYVKETSLVECTFTGPSQVADFRVKYYIASREIPFAGHPTVATVLALRHRGLIGDGEVTLETGAGLVRAEVGDGGVTMTQVAPRFGPTVAPDVVAAVGGIGAEDIICTPQVVSTGLAFCITVLRDRAALDRVRLDLEALHAFARTIGQDDIDITEPYWIIREGATGRGDTFARLLIAPPSPPEDPFTGSATGAAAAYLWARGLIDSPRYAAEQGHGMGRPGQAQVEVLGPRDAITGVRVGGQGRIVMSGDVFMPDRTG
ncbi:PhzF family phenazine biosynthesis protein [Sulfitobacter sp. JB4-11]|uniref:PhzF family phenazine biosynthesis protein n=1 Tax=Sulfitobacter rhodophyticola TaxID=3238304 RepID=UPI003D817F6A